MSKETKQKEATEEVVDAKGGALAVPERSDVSAQVTVQGVTLHFPFIRKGEQMSQWKSEGRGPEQGAFYIGKNKELNVRIADPGRQGGFNAILLGADYGWVEEKQFDGNAPRRFFGDDATALAEAKKAGLDPNVRIPTGRVASDGYKYTIPQLSPFCLLKVLLPVDDTFTSMEFQMFPIGDRLYTPGRVEYGRKNFSALNDVLVNIRNVETFRHKKDPDWKFDLSGRAGHIFSVETQSKQTNNVYYSLGFELAMRDGKPFEFTKEEQEDFTKFLMSIRETTVSAEDAGDDVEK